MNTVTEIARDFTQLIRDTHPDVRILNTKYLSIDENSEVRIQSYPYNLEEARIVIAICHYRYMVKYCYDESFFCLFLDNNGWRDDFYMMDGWRIEFDKPKTTDYRTDNDKRRCTISKGELRALLLFKSVSDIEYKFAKAWPYIVEMTQCTTQKELECLVRAYKLDIEVKDLKEQNLEIKYSQMIINEQMQAYKAVLDKIKILIEKMSPSAP